MKKNNRDNVAVRLGLAALQDLAYLRRLYKLDKRDKIIVAPDKEPFLYRVCLN